MNDREFDELLKELGEIDKAFLEAPDKPKTVEIIKEPAPVETGKVHKKPTSAKVEEELNLMYQDLKEKFEGEFKNKDLGELLDKWGLSSRQTPSRLKKLAESGLLEDLGGSPKSYKVK